MLSLSSCVQVESVANITRTNMDGLNNMNNTSSAATNAGPTPYDFADNASPKGTDVDSNPFADFGANIEISDDELPF